jgi:hypothetical protein
VLNLSERNLSILRSHAKGAIGVSPHKMALARNSQVHATLSHRLLLSGDRRDFLYTGIVGRYEDVLKCIC